MKDTVTAELEVTARVDCPNCGETIYSDQNYKWDIGENYHKAIELNCDDCDHSFYVELPH